MATKSTNPPPKSLSKADLARIKNLINRINVSKNALASQRDMLREDISDLKEILFQDGKENADNADHAVGYLEDAVEVLNQLL